nr:phosphoethanolamine N-methyltransferase 3-like isoform X1 [Penaeus vannamei]
MSSPEPGAAPEERCEFLEEVIEEVLAWRPYVRGGRILYLGPGWICGLGREPSRLAQDADHVTFVLHMPSAAKGGASVPLERLADNVTCKCADVNELSFPPSSFEMVVGAWVLSGLSDLQANDFLHRVLDWLVPEGHFVFREACGFHEGPRPSNSTLPRSAVSYCQMLHSVNAGSSAFAVLRAKSLMSYIIHEGDPVKMCFLARRSQEGSAAQHAVDIRYSEAFILKLEWLLGHTWVSTGGESTTREFCRQLGLRPGQRVLDVGCGSGGSAFFMSRLYGVHVHGVDISSNMIDLAVQRQTHLRRAQRKRLQFEMRDILDADYGDCSFDVIYSRNSVLHITNKEELFAKLYRWLKPSGTLFVTDYCLGPAPTSRPFADYMAKSSMSLVTVRDYGRVVTRAGFSLIARDLGNEFDRIQQNELDAFIPTQEAFAQEYSQEEFEGMVTVATNKLTWIRTRQLTWASFVGRKL